MQKTIYAASGPVNSHVMDFKPGHSFSAEQVHDAGKFHGFSQKRNLILSKNAGKRGPEVQLKLKQSAMALYLGPMLMGIGLRVVSFRQLVSRSWENSAEGYIDSTENWVQTEVSL